MKRYVKWGAIAALTLVAFGLTLLLSESAPPTKIVFASGQSDSSYERGSLDVAALVEADDGPKVKTRETAGSVENLKLLSAGEVDAALIQTGVATELATKVDITSLRGVARLYSEPLWVFYRGDELVQLNQLGPVDGKRKRIFIGFDGSGTQLVSTELLRANGIDASNADLILLDTKTMLEQMERAELDVVFMISAPDSKAVNRLFRMQGVRAMSFTNQRAYSQRFPYLASVELAQGTLSFKDNVPPRDLKLVAPSAMLVVRDDTHPRVVEKLTKATVTRFSRSNLIDDAGVFPTAIGLELPQHAAAQRYMTSGESWANRNLPFWLLNLLTNLKLLLIPLLAVLVPALRIAPIVLGMRVTRAIRRNYRALRTIEEGILAGKDIDARLAELDALLADVVVRSRNLAARHYHVVYDFRLHADLVRREAEQRHTKAA
jgi:uncharacterized protein